MKRLFDCFVLTGLAIALMAGLMGCSSGVLETAAKPAEGVFPPVLNPITTINATLRALPPPERRVAVAVYGYVDQTGQFKHADTVQSLSRAVTQGATSVLIKALQDAGEGSWFLVVEREKLDNLLKERRIIADMRERYLGEKALNPQALPPLLFAGILLEGGIIGYDSNTRTGGAGARYLGVGGDVQYREDTVTIYLRAISTKTGEVLTSVVSHKTILSVGIKGGVFKFVALDRILEAEAGFTRNEPDQLAVQQAIEKAVYAMIMDGAARGLWAFSDKVYQGAAISRFNNEQDLAMRPAKAGSPQEPKTDVAKQTSDAEAKSVASVPSSASGQAQSPGAENAQPGAKPGGNLAATAGTGTAEAAAATPLRPQLRPANDSEAASKAAAKPHLWSVAVKTTPDAVRLAGVGPDSKRPEERLSAVAQAQDGGQ